jgi:hypothetical protein
VLSEIKKKLRTAVEREIRAIENFHTAESNLVQAARHRFGLELVVEEAESAVQKADEIKKRQQDLKRQEQHLQQQRQQFHALGLLAQSTNFDQIPGFSLRRYPALPYNNQQGPPIVEVPDEAEDNIAQDDNDVAMI